MLHILFTIEIIGKTQGGLNNFEHNFIAILKYVLCNFFSYLDHDDSLYREVSQVEHDEG